MYFAKSSVLHLIKATAVVSSLHQFVHGERAGNPGNVGQVKCVLQHIEPLMIDPSDEEVSLNVCEVTDEDGIAGIAYEFDESTLPYGFYKDVEFSKTTVTISAASLIKPSGKYGGGKIVIQPGASIKKEKKTGKMNKGNSNLRGSSDTLFDRKLSQKIGDSTLIVLYAMPPDAVNGDITSVQLANDIFGINTTEAVDPVNVKNQVARCSKGQLNYVPACGTQEQTCFNEPLIVNGILEVPISQNVTGIASGTVTNWVKAEAQVILNGTGVDIFSFEQIMVVIPDEASWGGAAAWASTPGQTSAFRDSYSYRMGIQMHEFGHNLGLRHSGYNGGSYSDHSCMMGNPSYGDDGPEICWNAAKSWESTWYAADSITVAPSTIATSVDLVGVADWTDDVYTPGTHRVVIEILDSTQSQDFYIMYNRAKGPNVGVTFAQDQVTISTGKGGTVSWHQAGLGAPNPGPTTNIFPKFRSSKYNGGDKDLVVKVCDMVSGAEGVTPDIAKVLIYTDDGPGVNNGEMCPGELGCISDAQCDDGNYCSRNTCNIETNTCEAPVDISAENCPSCGALTFCNPAGYCDVLCDDKKTCTQDSCVAGNCQHDPIPGCARHGAQLESWYGLGGSTVSDLTGSAAYQSGSPDEVMILQDSLKAPVDRGTDFGDRIKTYIYPNATGTYTFYIASDDASELWLSPDEDPANKLKIAWVTSWTGPENWYQEASQTSSPISLQAGNSYYLETLHKEGGGGDNIAVAWESIDASVNLAVIGGSETFFVEVPEPCTLDEQCTALATNPCEAGRCKLNGFCEYSPIEGCQNGGSLETWTGIGGNSLSALLADARYPNSPDETKILSDLLEAPKDRLNDFGSRLQTYLMPPVTCDYTFYIASDDEGMLNLSNNTDPANKKTIASNNGWTSSRDWFKYSSQKSAPIHLEKGKLVYLEAMYKEGGGGDNLAIGWECLQHGITLDVIDAKYTVVSPVEVSSQPTTGPSQAPSMGPSKSPSKAPTRSPVPPTSPPTNSPSSSPSKSPSNSPTPQPSNNPTTLPSTPMTSSPTSNPSQSPSKSPTPPPTSSPTVSPTTGSPTTSPSKSPSKAPVSTVAKYICRKNEPADVCTDGSLLGDSTCGLTASITAPLTSCGRGGKVCWLANCPSTSGPTAPTPTPPTPTPTASPPTPNPPIGSCLIAGELCSAGTCCNGCETSGKMADRVCL